MPTVRQEMMALLEEGEFSAHDISQILRLREKDVFDHLFHIHRSIFSHEKRLIVTPAACLECGYVFESRNRFTKPGKCPKCRGEHIQDPKYRIE